MNKYFKNLKLMKYIKPFDVPLDEYEGLIARREYWDQLGTEWGWSSVEEKIIRLAGFVQQGGNLKKILNRYAKSHDEEYRREIQYCELRYVLELFKNRKDMSMEYLPVDRVKRLNKDELTKLLSDLLKKSVRKGYELDSQYQTQENWDIKYTEKLTPSEYMDKVEGMHWRANPDEPFDSYLNRSKIWWDGVHSLW